MITYLKTVKKLSIFLLLALLTLNIQAQEIDFLLKGGHLIDAKNKINGKMDVAVKDGKVFRVAADIPASSAKKTVDISGLYISPGLLDIHGHVFHGTDNNYLSNSLDALPPDGFTFRAGVTTVVDAGGSGWKNIDLFRKNVVDQSKTRVLAFMNIVGGGMRGTEAYEQDETDVETTTKC
jgi:dihydroorotase